MTHQDHLPLRPPPNPPSQLRRPRNHSLGIYGELPVVLEPAVPEVVEVDDVAEFCLQDGDGRAGVGGVGGDFFGVGEGEDYVAVGDAGGEGEEGGLEGAAEGGGEEEVDLLVGC